MANNVQKAKTIIDTIKTLVNKSIDNANFNKKKKAIVQSLNFDGTANVKINNEVFENVEIRAGLQPTVGEVVWVEMPNGNTKGMYIDTSKNTIIGDGETLHTHNNLSLLESITQVMVDAWNNTVPHISDAIKHITSTERTLWDTVSDKVDKVDGKQLSTEDYTTADKNKLDGIETGANKYTHPDAHSLDEITETTAKKIMASDERTKLSGISTGANKVKTSTINGNILIDDIESKVYTHPNNHDDRYYTETEIDTKLAAKVDKISGKGLSTEDYTTAEKTKLAGVEDGANKYIHPPFHSATMITENESRRFVSDIKINEWDNKQNALGYIPENIANKGSVNGYPALDSNGKIPLSQLPDLSKQQTYVVVDEAERLTLVGLISGDKAYEKSTGDTYIWDGVQWNVQAKAEWENINLEWSNINSKPSSLPSDIDDSVSKKHSHSNKPILDIITQALVDGWNNAASHISDAVKHITSGERTLWNTVSNKVDKVTGKGLSTEDFTVDEKNKLAGISTEANKVEQSLTNGNIKVDGVEKTVYTHPANHDDRYYTENEIDAKLIAKSDATHNHTLAGLSEKNYSSLVGRPSDDNFNTLATLIDSADDDTLLIYDVSASAYKKITKGSLMSGLANDSTYVFIKHQEEFTTTENQTVFNLTKGSYQINTNRMSVYVWGVKQPLSAYTETSSTSVTLYSGLEAGTKVIFEYISVVSALDYIHANNHKTGGVDPITPADIGASAVGHIHDDRYYTETEINSKLSAKVDNSRVLTDVPAGAKFTDTITTINNKTGAITKADITALGIPAQDTVYIHPSTHAISEISGLQSSLDGKVDNSQVLTNVPLNAKFTDTIYTHPTSHPASIIAQDANNRFVSDTEKSTWNAKETTIGSQTKANTAEANAKAYTDAHDGNTTKHITSTERTNWNDANNKKHEHSNKTVIDSITQALINTWNTVTGKADIDHNHVKANIIDFPTTLPASGGNADTVDGKHSSDFATSTQGVKADNAFPSTGGTLSGNITAPRFYQQANGVPTSNLGNPSVTEMALFDSQFDNKIWFYPSSMFTFEYTNDEVNWTTQSITDSQIKNFVSGYVNASIYIPNGCKQYRIRIDNKNTYVYINALYMYFSTSGNSTKVKISKKRDDGDWVQHTNSDQNVSSWPGHLYLPFNTIPWSRASTSGHYRYIEILFIPNWSHATNNITLYSLELWGGYPAGSRSLFSWDGDKNATFPAQITATAFNGNASTATKLQTARKINGVKFDGSADITITANPNTHSHTASDVTDFTASVNSNANVSANTSARHTHSNKTILDGTEQSFTSALKTKLDGIASGANNYSLPVATSSVLGGVKSGTDITIDASGNVSVNDGSHNHIVSNVDGLQAALNLKANLTSPAFTGTPTAPTATSGTNTTQIATTAFVQDALSTGGYGDMLKSQFATNAKVENGYVDKAILADSATSANNASTATKLQTARTINGVSFDGSANITITANPNSHSHAISDLPVATSGTSNSTQLVRADDSRLSNARTPTTHSHTATDLPSGTTSVKGIVQLSSAINSTSTTLAATASAVKSAYDVGNHSHPYASTSHVHDRVNGIRYTIGTTAPSSPVSGKEIWIDTN